LQKKNTETKEEKKAEGTVINITETGRLIRRPRAKLEKREKKRASGKKEINKKEINTTLQQKGRLTNKCVQIKSEEQYS
jgi:hypothetical protein